MSLSLFRKSVTSNRTLPPVEVGSYYLENEILTVLIEPVDPRDERRYMIDADPNTRKIRKVRVFGSVPDGVDASSPSLTPDDLSVLQTITNACSLVYS